MRRLDAAIVDTVMLDVWLRSELGGWRGGGLPSVMYVKGHYLLFPAREFNDGIISGN